MPRNSGASRPLSAFLAAVLLPLLLVGSVFLPAGSAVAAAKAGAVLPAAADAVLYGETKGTANVALDETGYLPYRNATCAVSAWYEDVAKASEFVNGTILCHGEKMSAWGDTGHVRSSTTLSFNGMRGGQACAVNAFFDDPPDRWGYINAGQATGSALTFQSNQLLYGQDQDPCIVSEVCMLGNYTKDLPFMPDWHWDYAGCSDIDLGAYPKAGQGASCQYGNPARLDFQDMPSGQFGPSYHQHWTDLHFVEGTPSQSWNVMFLLSGPQGIDGFATNTHGSWVDSNTHSAHPTGTTRLQSGGASTHVLGVQVTHTSRAQSSSDWGFNEPAVCNFYIGEKIRSDPNSERDEPAFAVNTDAPPAGGGSATPPGGPDPSPEAPVSSSDCGFSFTDASTWAGAAFCELVDLLSRAMGILQGIWDAITGVAAAIVDGIQALFVPSSGFLDELFAQVKDDWATSTPGNYLGALTGLDLPSGGSGCEGPTVTIPVRDNAPSFKPLDACSGAMATLASSSRLLLTVSVTLAGGFACTRILGRSLGWDPGIGGR